MFSSCSSLFNLVALLLPFIPLACPPSILLPSLHPLTPSIYANTPHYTNWQWHGFAYFTWIIFTGQHLGLTSKRQTYRWKSDTNTHHRNVRGVFPVIYILAPSYQPNEALLSCGIPQWVHGRWTLLLTDRDICRVALLPEFQFMYFILCILLCDLNLL